MQSGIQFGVNPFTFTLVTIGSLVFGFAYNWFVAWLEKEGRHYGYISLLVVFGVLITLLISSFLIGIQPTLYVLYVFSLTGLFMVIGAAYRYTERRKHSFDETLDIHRALEDIKYQLNHVQRQIDEGSDDSA